MTSTCIQDHILAKTNVTLFRRKSVLLIPSMVVPNLSLKCHKPCRENDCTVVTVVNSRKLAALEQPRTSKLMKRRLQQPVMIENQAIFKNMVKLSF